MTRDYPEELKGMQNNAMSVNTILYMMAKDVALDLAGFDPRNIELSGDRVVVWYAAADEDCPPSHGEWLANRFRAKTRVYDGYGHAGGALIDQDQFIEELMGRP